MALSDQIRADILAGLHTPGSLLSQTTLATRYGVSRIPVRDALQSLAAEKLVEILPNKTARVTLLSPDDLTEIFDLRVTLECDLLARAMLAADKTALAEIDYALQKSSIEAGRPGWQAGDWLFHQALYTPAQRPRQLAIVAELRSACVLYAPKYDTLSTQTNRWLNDHNAIFDAYASRQISRATGLLRDHIMGAQAHL
jgi:DNA-binding GntR family transcriptional regulator